MHVPKAVFHSTVNTGWEPLRLLALYSTGGAEKALTELPDYGELPAGEVSSLRRA